MTKYNKKIKRLGIMLVISSPSGAGKTTLARKLISEDDGIELSISVTTRKRRKLEKNTEEDIMVNKKTYKSMIKKKK